MKFLSNITKQYNALIAKGHEMLDDFERGLKITIVIVTALALMMVYAIYKIHTLIGMH